MKTKSILAALGVMTLLVLGNGATAEAKTNETEVSSKIEAPVIPVVAIDEIVVVKSGDTLATIAAEHETTYMRLFNANPSITHPDMINVGDEITIPAIDNVGEDRYAQLAQATAPAAASASGTYTTQQYTSAPVNSSSYYVGNGMWCTDYVHSKRPDVAIYGNAGYNWISSAQAAGKSTGSAPKAGAVAVMNGHVAYVESVNSDGSYVVSEMGWNYQAGNYNQRTVKPGAFGAFIY